MSKRKLPPYVYRGKSAYEYKPYIKRRKNQKRPTIRLCSLDAPMSEVWQAWEGLQSTHSDKPLTVAWLINHYIASEDFSNLAKKTQIAYRSYTKTLINYKIKADGNPASFGSLIITGLRRQIIQQYIRNRRDCGAPIGGNREIKILRAAWEWAINEGLIDISNPAIGVKYNTEKPRDRYITDDEYNALYELAGRYPTSCYLLPAMEIARLCGARRTEVLDARLSQVTNTGFQVKRVKGSKDTLVHWSPRLRKAIEACKATHGKIKQINKPDEEIYLLQDGHGNKVNYYTFGNTWDRLKKRALKSGIIASDDFTFHDLKAKAISDSKGDKQVFGGHKTAAMTARYNRSIDEVDTSE